MDTPIPRQNSRAITGYSRVYVYANAYLNPYATTLSDVEVDIDVELDIDVLL